MKRRQFPNLTNEDFYDKVQPKETPGSGRE